MLSRPQALTHFILRGSFAERAGKQGRGACWEGEASHSTKERRLGTRQGVVSMNRASDRLTKELKD